MELASLILDSKRIQLNQAEQVVTHRPPASKTTAAWKVGKDPLCPYHAVSAQLRAQCQRLGSHDRKAIPEGTPACWTTASFVDKRVMTEEAQRPLSVFLEDNEDYSLEVSNVTAHFIRRSGVKGMTGRGCSFTSIQWFARHSRQTTWDDTEEAWGETPERAVKLKNEMQLAEKLASALQKVSELEDAFKEQEEGLKPSSIFEKFNRNPKSFDTGGQRSVDGLE